jgi:hypothetical protein
LAVCQIFDHRLLEAADSSEISKSSVRLITELAAETENWR